MSNSIKDALKKLCYKITGKKSNKESIQDVIDDIQNNYDGDKIDSLKQLGLRINGLEPSGNDVAEVIDSLANDYEENRLNNPIYLSFIQTNSIEEAPKNISFVATINNYDNLYSEGDKYIATFHIKDEETGIIETANITTVYKNASVNGYRVYPEKDNIRYTYKVLKAEDYSGKTMTVWATLTYKHLVYDKNGNSQERLVYYTTNSCTFTFPTIEAPQE